MIPSEMDRTEDFVITMTNGPIAGDPFFPCDAEELIAMIDVYKFIERMHPGNCRVLKRTLAAAYSLGARHALERIASLVPESTKQGYREILAQVKRDRAADPECREADGLPPLTPCPRCGVLSPRSEHQPPDDEGICLGDEPRPPQPRRDIPDSDLPPDVQAGIRDYEAREAAGASEETICLGDEPRPPQAMPIESQHTGRRLP